MEQPGHLSLEITNSCNELCRHCYHPEKRNSEFLTDIELLDKMLAEFGELGFMFLTITGGEPLLHPKFKEICELSQKNRYIISIKTNGTLITNEIVEFFRKLKPNTVEISLYSADPDEHDHITGIIGSWAKSMESVHLLKRNGVKVSVMTPVLKSVKKWTELYELMKKAGIPWSCSPNIHSSLDEREQVEKFKGTFEGHLRFLEFVNRYENQKITNIDDLCFKQCGGGETVACIGSDFSVRPCISYPEKAGIYKEGNTLELLKLAKDLLIKRFNLLECHNCDLVKFCSPCPAHIKIVEGIGICEQTKKEYAKAYKQFFESLIKQELISFPIKT